MPQSKHFSVRHKTPAKGWTAGRLIVRKTKLAAHAPMQTVFLIIHYFIMYRNPSKVNIYGTAQQPKTERREKQMILYELCQKDVIDLHTGKNLGTVDDIAFDETSAIITHLVIYGKWKLFGLLGRHPDTRIPWKAIRTIGKDAVLVNADLAKQEENNGK